LAEASRLFDKAEAVSILLQAWNRLGAQPWTCHLGCAIGLTGSD
jgi:hypothetical protein